MRAVNIRWCIDDADEDNLDLPDVIDLPEELADDEEIDYDGIDDYLSDLTGFLQEGYCLEE